MDNSRLEKLLLQLREQNKLLRSSVCQHHDYNPALFLKKCGCYSYWYECELHLDERFEAIREKWRVHKSKNKDPRSAEEGTEYAFTLTMPPDYQPVNPLPEVAKKILEYGLSNKPYEKAIEYAYVLEHTEKGTPHIHGVYRTASGRRISSKYFKRYWPLWTENPKEPGYKKLGNGFIGGYHAKARHAESYKAYLEKEGVVTKIKSLPLISDAASQIQDV